MNLIAGIVLAGLAGIDIKRKSIPVLPVLGLGVTLLAFRLTEAETAKELLCGFLPGIVLTLISFFSKEGIGMGDALVLLCLGAGYRWEKVTAMLFGALCLAAVFSLVLLILKKADRKTELPFLPFLFFGWCIVMLGGGR